MAGLFYKKFKNIYLSAFGEVIGTEFLGALIAYPIAILLMGKKVGVLFPSSTKRDAIGITVDALMEIRSSVPIAIYGIGGITDENLNCQILRNIDSIAVVSAILRKENTEESVRKFNRLLNG